MNVVSSSIDNTIQIWSSESFELIKIVNGHINWVVKLTFIPTSERIISGSDDVAIKVWDPKSFQLIASLNVHSILLFMH